MKVNLKGKYDFMKANRDSISMLLTIFINLIIHKNTEYSEQYLQRGNTVINECWIISI